jgi:hypothetical protein
MFTGTRRLDHDAWVRTAVAAASTVTAEEAADAFLASLTTRRLDLRSALGSYALAGHLREHPFTVPRDLIYDGYAPVSRTTAPCAGSAAGRPGSRTSTSLTSSGSSGAACAVTRSRTSPSTSSSSPAPRARARQMPT